MKPHQPKPKCEECGCMLPYHKWNCIGMLRDTQPKPTGEWTVASVWRDFGSNGNILKIKKLADAHNAAIYNEWERHRAIGQPELSSKHTLGDDVNLAQETAREISKRWRSGKFRQYGGVVKGIELIVRETIKEAYQKGYDDGKQAR